MFKRYNRKRSNTACKNITVDRKHNQILNKLDKKFSTLPAKKKKLDRLRKQLIKADKSYTLEEDDFNHHFLLLDQIENLEKDIEYISAGIEKNAYFMDTSELLFSYYDQEEMTSAPTEITKGGILTYFGNMNSVPIVETPKDNKCRHRKGSLSRLYFQTIDPDHYQQSSKVNRVKCDVCNMERTVLHANGLIVCQNEECSACGVSEEIVIDAKKSSYKDPPPEVSYYAYQRKNHFLEILAQFQAKESTNIPENVFTLLKEEIRKERLQNLAKLSYIRIKGYLKKLGESKHYEHIPYIRFKLTGEPAPQFSPEVERKLILMFDMAQEPFDKICPQVQPKRDNFLNYRYVLYKFVELLDMEEYKKYLKVLKNRTRLLEQDQIWKGMCEEIQKQYPKWKDIWIFRPTAP